MSAATRASLALPPSPNRPSPGTRITRGTGSSSRFGVAWRGVVAGEIGVVVGDEAVDRVAHRLLELVEPARLGRRHDQRVVLGADRVVGRGDPGLA